MAPPAWLNVGAPITIEQLRGKVVILDFWTYGCINCMHVLRDLKTLEQRFPNELVVIGVHSPKFTNEKDPENLKRVLVRYEIEHPVANDANLEIWRRYGARAWPTRIIIDPAGNLVGTALGEGNLDGFLSAIRTVVRVFDERGELNRSPLPLDPERNRHSDRPLLYPGKVLADEKTDRLYIADSNHNRIVVTTLSGKLIETIGSGLQGDNDGIFLQARFYRPQGLRAGWRSALRRRHREPPGSRRRLHGAGGPHACRHRQAGRRGAVRAVMRFASTLNSPWDLALKPGILIVAMAGSHQIWVIDLLNDQAYPYAGTGEEARRDGAVNGAAFAQPSGIAVDGNTLYVADAECNAIRAVQLPPDKPADARLPAAICSSSAIATAAVMRCGCSIRLAWLPATAACSSPIPTTTRSSCSTRRPARSRPSRPASTSRAVSRSRATRSTSPTRTITPFAPSISRLERSTPSRSTV